ncbi:MAG: nicotinate-nucleotide--dimethylbenzimidazole phosphoribosyltransferase [Pseudomonadota bacterium]
MDSTIADFDGRLKAALDTKTKPVGSLGRIESLAASIAKIQQTLRPRAETCDHFIFAADHGIAKAGVSAFPQAVTRQMVQNFLNGGAAANVFARSVGASVYVVDAGIAGAPIAHAELLNRRQGAGTANSLEQPAMSQQQSQAALDAGAALAEQSQADVICCGEMGIGNTSAAALVSAKLLGLDVQTLVGRGTGLDDEGLAKKSQVLQRAAARTASNLTVDVALREYGGFEIAMMAGAMRRAAETGRIVIVDGFIATVSALCAVHLSSASRQAFVFAHQSAESGHRTVLDALQAEPLLQLDLRLGEGTGALLAFPLVKAAAAMLRDMASFDDAGISGPA